MQETKTKGYSLELKMNTQCPNCHNLVAQDGNIRGACPYCQTVFDMFAVVNCPRCKAMATHNGKRFTTPGIILLVVGLLTSLWGIGIIFIIASIVMRQHSYACNACGNVF